MTAPPKVIRVTADHIAKGGLHDSCCCPISRALEEQAGFPEFSVHVTGVDIDVFGPSGELRLTAILPPEAALFVRAFDDERPVEPFEFAVEWIDPDEATS